MEKRNNEQILARHIRPTLILTQPAPGRSKDQSVRKEDTTVPEACEVPSLTAFCMSYTNGVQDVNQHPSYASVTTLSVVGIPRVFFHVGLHQSSCSAEILPELVLSIS